MSLRSPVARVGLSDDQATEDVDEERDAGDGADTQKEPAAFSRRGFVSRYAIAANDHAVDYEASPSREVKGGHCRTGSPRGSFGSSSVYGHLPGPRERLSRTRT